MLLTAVKAQEIGDLGTMLSLVLVLLPLFTAHRTSELRKLKREPWHLKVRRQDLAVEICIIVGLLVLTVMLLTATGGLLRAVLADGGLFRRSTAVHSVFFVSWLLLICLALWQAQLLAVAAMLRRESRG
jgi:hypothetical protein